MKPGYLSLTPDKWKMKIAAAYRLLNPCLVCPWECQVDRLDPSAPLGYCRTKETILISSAQPHFGEENCLVGQGGSGTVFFTSCNLSCVYCQNYPISQLREGRHVSPGELAQRMIYLQKQGCHNINLVSPTIWLPQILSALEKASREGLSIPVVYNTSGYDRLETLRLLESVVDIYMPDIKYADNQFGRKYSGVLDYWKVARKAVGEMHRQVGDLVIDNQGVAQRGLLVRHLILPNDVAGSGKIIRFLAEEISLNTYLNLMDQYYPSYQATNFTELSRRITEAEFEKVEKEARKAGLHRLDHLC